MSIWLMMRHGESRCLAPWTQHLGDLKMTASPQSPRFTVVISPPLVDSCQLLRIQLWLALGNSFPFPTCGCLDWKPIPVRVETDPECRRVGQVSLLSKVLLLSSSLEQLLRYDGKVSCGKAQRWFGLEYFKCRQGWGRQGHLGKRWSLCDSVKTSWWPLRMLIS